MKKSSTKSFFIVILIAIFCLIIAKPANAQWATIDPPKPDYTATYILLGVSGALLITAVVISIAKNNKKDQTYNFYEDRINISNNLQALEDKKSCTILTSNSNFHINDYVDFNKNLFNEYNFIFNARKQPLSDYNLSVHSGFQKYLTSDYKLDWPKDLFSLY
jgi:hypothetical protein